MKITVFGAGYVGLVTGVGFADLGNEVLCVDIDEKRIQMLDAGGCPIYEPGLEEKLRENREHGRLSFSTKAADGVAHGELLFVCVGTPSSDDGSVDTKYVEAVAKSIGEIAEHPVVVVVKSTVPVGTGAKVKEIITQALKERDSTIAFSVVSNPEFLKEGAALADFFNPDRVVVGLEEGDAPSRAAMEKLYKGIVRTGRPILFTTLPSAELIKYASNAMLAARISFMNKLSVYCEAVGANVKEVAKGMGLDSRIGPRFLQAGLGYGGSCFPKDVLGLIKALEAEGVPPTMLREIHEVNEEQKRTAFAKVQSLLGEVKGKTVALWGLSFKPKTDDVREAPAMVLVKALLEAGASVRAYDPEAMENFKKEFPASQSMTYCEDEYEAVGGADALVLVTEWDSFRNPDWKRVKRAMKTLNLVDGRNIYRALREDLVELGFSYVPVGAAPVLQK